MNPWLKMARLKPLTIEELDARGVDVAPFMTDFAELPGSVATLGYRPDILQATLAAGSREIQLVAAQDAITNPPQIFHPEKVR